jgi:hypothetical protein
MEIVVYILALIGLACVIKHIRIMPCSEGCYLRGWQKMKGEEKEEQGEGEKTTGSRYGSNPIQY